MCEWENMHRKVEVSVSTRGCCEVVLEHREGCELHRHTHRVIPNINNSSKLRGKKTHLPMTRVATPADRTSTAAVCPFGSVPTLFVNVGFLYGVSVTWG